MKELPKESLLLPVKLHHLAPMLTEQQLLFCGVIVKMTAKIKSNTFLLETLIRFTGVDNTKEVKIELRRCLNKLYSKGIISKQKKDQENVYHFSCYPAPEPECPPIDNQLRITF